MGFEVWQDAPMHLPAPWKLLSLAFLASAAVGCKASDGTAEAPQGSPTDPVTDCAKHGQVCKIDSSRLGVCTEVPEEKRDAVCQGAFPCLQCAPQH